MVTRRHIRIKVLQSVYSYKVAEKKGIADEVQFFKESTFKITDLYLSLLSLFVGLNDFIQEQLITYRTNRIEDNFSKDLKRLSENQVMQFLHSHPVLKKHIKNKKIIRWEVEFIFLKDLLHTLFASSFFESYRLEVNPSVKQDIDLVVYFFKEVIAPADYLYDYLEEKQLTWIDDLPVVNTYLIKNLKQIDIDDPSSLHFPEVHNATEDLLFGVELLEKTLQNDTDLQSEIEGKTPNWDPDRIALMDRIILKTAIAELLYFPLIPSKVTLNEYLEIAKDYSTPKSFHFVNGVLDKLVREFSAENRLNKKGRGLL